MDRRALRPGAAAGEPGRDGDRVRRGLHRRARQPAQPAGRAAQGPGPRPAQDGVPARRDPRRRLAGVGRGRGRLHPVPDEWPVRHRRVRVRSRVHHQGVPADPAPARPELVPGRGAGHREPADHRFGAAGLQPRRHHAVGRHGAAVGRLRRDRAARPDARRRPDLQDPVLPRLRAPDRHHPGLSGGRRAAARLRPAGGRLPGGVQGARQAVRRPLQAAALRPRRLRLGRRPGPGPADPGLDRRLGGDLPADRERADPGPGDGRARTSRSRRCSPGSGSSG